jgi:hypothetical protein
VAQLGERALDWGLERAKRCANRQTRRSRPSEAAKVKRCRFSITAFRGHVGGIRRLRNEEPMGVFGRAVAGPLRGGVFRACQPRDHFRLS